MIRTISSLDIGSHKIACVIAEYDDEKDIITIKGASVRETKGIEGGKLNSKLFTSNITKAVSQAEKMYGKNITSLLVSISSVKAKPIFVDREYFSKKPMPTMFDFEKITQEMVAEYNFKQETVLHSFPISWTKQGHSNTKDAVNAFNVRFFISVAPTKDIEVFEKIIKSNIVHKIDLITANTGVYSALAVRDDINDNGTLVVDMGCDSTKFCILTNSNVIYTNSLNIAGKIITYDIAMVLKVDEIVAEKIKVANTDLKLDPYEENEIISFDFDGYSDNDDVFRVSKYNKKLINDIYTSRVEEIFKYIFKDIEKHNLSKTFNKIILTGGSSGVRGLDLFIQNLYGVTTKQGNIVDINIAQPLVTDQIKSPVYATSIGLIVAGANIIKRKIHNSNNYNTDNYIVRFIQNFTKILMDLFIS